MCQEFILNNDNNAELTDNNNEDQHNGVLPDIDESDHQLEEQTNREQGRYFFEINVRPEPSPSNLLLLTTNAFNNISEDNLSTRTNSPRFFVNNNLDSDENRVNDDDEPTAVSINRGRNRRRRHRRRLRERRRGRRVIKQLKKIKKALRKTNLYLRHVNRLLQRNLNLTTPAQTDQNSTNS